MAFFFGLSRKHNTIQEVVQPEKNENSPSRRIKKQYRKKRKEAGSIYRGEDTLGKEG